MAIEPVAEGESKRDQNHRHHNACEHRMRDQDGKVQRARPSLSAKVHRPDMVVVVEIASEECRRNHKCCDHYSAMFGYRSAFDEMVTNRQQHGSDSV